MFLVTDWVGYSCCSFQKAFHLFRGVFFFGGGEGVAIGLSDLSRGTRLLLYGGWGGDGGSGFVVWFLLGF